MKYNKVYLRQRMKYYKYTYKPCLFWSLCAIKAMNFLKLIQPYLKIKKKQADIAIKFQTHRSASKKRRRKNGTCLRVSSKEFNYREKCRKTISLLNTGIKINDRPVVVRNLTKHSLLK